jgi:hypothetical protein
MPHVITYEAAERFARAIISDIALYNKAKVLDGIKNDTIFDVLDEELKEGYNLFIGRVTPEFAKETNIYNRAIVDVLIKRSGNIESDIW